MGTRISDNTFVGLALAAAVLFVADGYLLQRINRLSRSTALLETSIASEVSRIRQISVRANDDHQDGIEALAAQLVATKDETTLAAAKARLQAQRYAERLAGRVARVGRKEDAWVEGELKRIRSATAQTADDARRLESQVREARKAEAAVRAVNKSHVESTRAASQGLSGIGGAALSRREQIAEFRRANEKEVIAFELTKIGEPREVGGVRLTLLRADHKHNRYSLAIKAGESSLEAKDKGPNEPVRLYTAGRQRPLEVVVNEIEKDRVRGVLMIPKATEPSWAYSSASADTENFPTR